MFWELGIRVRQAFALHGEGSAQSAQLLQCSHEVRCSFYFTMSKQMLNILNLGL